MRISNVPKDGKARWFENSEMSIIIIGDTMIPFSKSTPVGRFESIVNRHLSGAFKYFQIGVNDVESAEIQHGEFKLIKELEQ